jgi:hypothetical protein
MFLGALLMMEGWIYRARASGGVRFVSPPEVQQEPHQFQPQGTITVVGMTPSTCATAVRFLPQIDVQQGTPCQAVPPIDTASGITPAENFQDGIYMRNKGSTSQSHHARFRCTVQAAYDKACHLNQIQHAHQGADYKKAIREDQGFGAQSHHASFRHAVQAAYDKACHLNQIQHAHQSADYKKAIREDQGLGASLWSAFPGCSNGSNFTQGVFEGDDGQDALL